MIDHLIEIVFKNIPADEIGFLLKDLTSDGQEINRYYFTCECSAIDWNNEKLLKEIFINNENFGLFINLKELKKDSVCLKNCGLVIYKYENKIDLEINFKLFDLNPRFRKGLTSDIMKLAKSIANQYKIDLYFCGIEPAEDANTRLFTKEEIGPLSIED